MDEDKASLLEDNINRIINCFEINDAFYEQLKDVFPLTYIEMFQVILFC